ncbi:hypothetical protein ACSBR1_000072 [Camellia fascicularis]
MGLLDDIPQREGRPIAAGQPYFISDGSPVNSFEFLRPLLQSLSLMLLFWEGYSSWGYSLLLFPKSNGGAWLCPYGESSGGHGRNHIIFSREENEKFGRAYNIYMDV